MIIISSAFKQFVVISVLIGIGFSVACKTVQTTKKEPDENTEKTKAEIQTSEPDFSSFSGNSSPEKSEKDNYFSRVNKQKKQRPGMYGRLTIPSVGVNVALFWADSETSLAYRQKITDAKDSACFFRNYPQNEYYYVADHNYQGFNSIKKCVVNKTKMFINDGNTIKEYLCIYINRDVLRTVDGRIKRTDEMKSMAKSNFENVVVYTCNGNSQNITWIVFTPIN